LLGEHDNAKLTDVGTTKYATSITEDTALRFGLIGSRNILNSLNMMSRLMGSRGYVDPEYATSMQYGAPSEVYSFGVVMLRLWTGYPAVQGLVIESRATLTQVYINDCSSSAIFVVVDCIDEADNTLLSSRMRLLFRTDKLMTKAINYVDPTSGEWPVNGSAFEWRSDDAES